MPFSRAAWPLPDRAYMSVAPTKRKRKTSQDSAKAKSGTMTIASDPQNYYFATN